MIRARNTRTGRRYDVRLRDPAGRVYTRTFATKRDAEACAAAEKTDQVRGAWVDPRRGVVTLAEWSERWLAQRPLLRPRTRELYQGLLANHILPVLGDMELSKISPSEVRSWYSRLHGPGGTGECTAAKAYRLLRAMMRTAVADEVIVRNPCAAERGGVERSPERPVLSVAQVGALADAIAPRFRAVVLVSAWCGLRRGKCLALRRSDFDPLHKTLRVERAMNQLIDGTLIVGPPKTEAGRRSVAVPPHIIPDLLAHLDRFVDTRGEALMFTGGQHLGGGYRRFDEGTDGPHGTHQLGGPAPLPARDGRPRPGHCRRAFGIGNGRKSGPASAPSSGIGAMNAR